MIDNIKIRLNSFSGNFSNCLPLKNRNKEGLNIYDNYNLRSLKSNNPSILRISLNKLTNQVSISGSIRKWYLGKDTLKDLNKSSLEKAFIALAKNLNISTFELYSADFTQSEIGQNVKLSIPIEQLNPLLVKYANKQEFKEYGDFETTNYFKSSKRELIIYDKLDSIAYDNPKKRRAMWTLQKHGHYFIRIEFALYNKSSRNLKQIKHIEKLGDLITFYQDVWKFWYSEINKIIVESKIDLKAKGLNRRNRSISVFLNRMGFIWVESQLLNIAKSISDDGLVAKKRRIKIQLLNLMKKYSNQNSYSKEMFMKEIDNHVLKHNDS